MKKKKDIDKPFEIKKSPIPKTKGKKEDTTTPLKYSSGQLPEVWKSQEADNMYEVLKKNCGRYFSYTPEGLFYKFQEYIKWATDNPLYAARFDKGLFYKESRMRPWSERAFRLFAGISRKTWWCYVNGRNHDNEEDPKYKIFSEICDFIVETCYNQKLEGASTDLLNASIIARDLGLTDKKEIKGFMLDGTETIEFE